MPASPNCPYGLNGFEFVEYTGPNVLEQAKQLEMLGFTAVSKHPTRDVARYKQGGINFLLNGMNEGQAADFAAEHGPSANAMAFRVTDPTAAHKLALERGAKPADGSTGSLGADSHALQGIGGSLLYLVKDDGENLYADWLELPTAKDELKNSVGLHTLDHLTHNVRRGQMRTWSTFYGEVFGFTEQKYFDIKGKATALFSQAMVAPDGAIRIPLNESQDENSQIEEFLNEYNGEGIQHIALSTDNIYNTVETLRARGVALQDTIDTYFDLIDKRIPGHGEDVDRMRKNRILIDSPGFDADDQRTSTLRITDHILDLSDLVLVFFDARHPEPGAMQDTLEHLVSRTVKRTDASKFFYVLNQIDTAAKEDNPEAVVGAWQRAIAQAGLTAGKFFTIYNEAAAVPIEDPALRARFQSKRDADLNEIHARMDEIEVQRNYRIVSVLETVANELEDDLIPQLRKAKAKWRRNVLIGDGLALGLLTAAFIGFCTTFNMWPPAHI